MNNQQTPQTNIQEQFAETTSPIGLPWRIMIFSAVILALSIFMAVGLKLGYEKYLDDQLSNINTKISALSSSVQDKQQEYIGFYSQIVNLKTIIERRSFTANIFPFLEKNTISSVYYTQAQMVSSENKLTVKGFASSLGNLSQQVAIFEKDVRDVSGVVLDSVNLQSGGVIFSLSIYFTNEFSGSLSN